MQTEDKLIIGGHEFESRYILARRERDSLKPTKRAAL